MKGDPHRTRGEVQYVGDLCGRPSLGFLELEHRSLERRQPVQRPIEGPSRLRPEENVVRGPGPRRPGGDPLILRGEPVHVVRGQRLVASATTEEVDGLVEDDAVEPRADPGLTSEGIDLLQRGGEGLLDGVGGEVGVTGGAEGQGVQPDNIGNRLDR